MSKKTRHNVTIGQPVDSLPDAHLPSNSGNFAPHWVRVGAACLQHEGQWVPVRIGHLSVDRHRQVVSEINNGRLAAFRNWPGFKAAYRDNTLYVRYDDPESATDPDLKVVGA